MSQEHDLEVFESIVETRNSKYMWFSSTHDNMFRDQTGCAVWKFQLFCPYWKSEDYRRNKVLTNWNVLSAAWIDENDFRELSSTATMHNLFILLHYMWSDGEFKRMSITRKDEGPFGFGRGAATTPNLFSLLHYCTICDRMMKPILLIFAA